jgi:disulfide bond formation protein DsbB
LIHARRQRRWLNLAGVAAVAGLIGYALYAQYVLGLEACPLCIFQRVAMIGVGAVLLIAGLHAPVSKWARVYGLGAALVAAIGAGISARHVYIQHLPEDQVPTCGPGLNYMVDAFGVPNAIKMVLTGSGECHAINWHFLGLTMPGWVLIWFVLLGALGVFVNWGRVAR